MKFKSILYLSLSFLMGTAWAGNEIREDGKSKPWMLFVTQILPPRGAEYAPAFSRVCFERLKKFFGSTSYQLILLRPDQTPEKLSNRKKDLIIYSDNSDYFVRGTDYDTLILWVRYRVGFNHSRVAIPYKRGASGPLPELVAQYIFTTITSEFLSELSLQGGPPGFSIALSEGITVYPPCTFYIPPGMYGITASYPHFKTRTDSLEIFPGKMYTKRMLLLPD